MKKCFRMFAVALTAISLTFVLVSCGNDKVKVESISLDKISVELTEAAPSATLTATVIPADASNKDVTWSTSDEDIVKIDSVDNVATITRVNAGKATITVISDADPGIKAECEVTAPGLVLSQYNGKVAKMEDFDTIVITASMIPANASAVYTAVSEDTTFATVSVVGDKITIRGIKALEEDADPIVITVSASGEDVSPAEFELDIIEFDLVNPPADGILYDGNAFTVAAERIGGDTPHPETSIPNAVTSDDVEITFDPVLDVRAFKKIIITFESGDWTDWWFGAVATDAITGEGDKEYFEWEGGDLTYEITIETVNFLDFLQLGGGCDPDNGKWDPPVGCWTGLTEIKLTN